MSIHCYKPSFDVNLLLLCQFEFVYEKFESVLTSLNVFTRVQLIYYSVKALSVGSFEDCKQCLCGCLYLAILGNFMASAWIFVYMIVITLALV